MGEMDVENAHMLVDFVFVFFVIMLQPIAAYMAMGYSTPLYYVL